MIEYKIISESSGWGYDKVRRKIEAAINQYAKKGWRVASISFATGCTYYGFATLERDTNINDYV